MSKIDSEFEELASQINEKLAEATKALNEANKLADKAKLPGLFLSSWVRDEAYYNKNDDEEDEDAPTKLELLEEKFKLIKVRDFESAMGNAGWSSSSSYC
jgi:hypothetical protein